MMNLSWLLNCSLLIVVAARKGLTFKDEAGPGIEELHFVLSQNPLCDKLVSQQAVIRKAMGSKA
jgi:hypothetical protein